VTKERRLGRGLEALLGRLPGAAETRVPEPGPYGGAGEEPYASSMPHETPPERPTPVEPTLAEATPMPAEPPVAEPGTSQDSPQPQSDAPAAQRLIDVRLIESNPAQPRQNFDPAEISSLAASLTSHGLLQPVVVRPVDGQYQLIAGERRLRAAVQAGWAEVPANVVEADDRRMVELAIVENLQRKDLNPLEKAAAFQQYLETYGGTQEELAARLNIDRSTVANLIRLLELPEPVQDAIRNVKITQGHARALLPLGEEQEQIDFCQRIQREALNVRQTEAAVQEAICAADGTTLGVIDREGKASRPARAQSEHLAALEQELRAALGTKVKLTHNARGRGKLVIHFRNHEEFERLRQRITEPGGPETRDQAG